LTPTRHQRVTNASGVIAIVVVVGALGAATELVVFVVKGTDECGCCPYGVCDGGYEVAVLLVGAGYGERGGGPACVGGVARDEAGAGELCVCEL